MPRLTREEKIVRGLRAMAGLKYCPDCKRVKRQREFYITRANDDGCACICKRCSHAVVLRFHHAHPNRNRNRKMLCKYGITLFEYHQLLREQGGVCAICQRPPCGERFVVDHEHATDAVRGLVHRICNLMIGFASDDPTILEAGAHYLRQWIIRRAVHL